MTRAADTGSFGHGHVVTLNTTSWFSARVANQQPPFLEISFSLRHEIKACFTLAASRVVARTRLRMRATQIQARDAEPLDSDTKRFYYSQ